MEYSFTEYVVTGLVIAVFIAVVWYRSSKSGGGNGSNSGGSGGGGNLHQK